MTTPTAINRADVQIKALLEVAANGFPACYVNFEDYLMDYCMDFTWGKGCVPEINCMLEDPRMDEVHTLIMERFKFDMRADLVAMRDFNLRRN